MSKRVFLVVMDSFGIGNAPDAAKFDDFGANTLLSLYNSKKLFVPNLEKLGLFKINGVNIESGIKPIGQFGQLIEKSVSKDTVSGHWEMMGKITRKPFATFPEGFPESFLIEFSKKIGRGILCNKPYSGTDVIRDYGQEHIDTGKIILYTSADSVLQIATHEDVVSLSELYEICEIAREMVNDMKVGRVIARPFKGNATDGFVRDNANRHDYALTPKHNLLNDIKEKGLQSIAVGKIMDIFNGSGITENVHTESNEHGMDVTLQYLIDKGLNFTEGLCFTNLVDFDAVYGHRRDTDGYVEAVNKFDKWLGTFINKMTDEDYLIITADHGCDPEYKGTDHTRETVPLLMYNPYIKPKDLGIFEGFDNVAEIIKGKLNIY